MNRLWLAGVVGLTAAYGHAGPPGPIQAIYTKIPGSPTEVVPGAVDLAGLPAVTTFRQLFQFTISPDGTTWAFRGSTQQGSDLENIVIKGSGASGSMWLQEGRQVPAGLPGELIEFFGSGFGRFNDANDFAISLRARGATTLQKVISWTSGGGWMAEFQQGDLYTGLADTGATGDEAVGNSVGSIHILNDGRIGSQDSTVTGIASTRRPVTAYDLAGFRQSNVSIVTGLDGIGNETVSNIVANSFYTTTSGTRWGFIGDVARPAGFTNAVIVNDSVLMRQQELLPSLGWQPFGSGTSGQVLAVTTWDPDGDGPLTPQLVAGGSFLTAGGVTVNSIARWDGSAWHAFGTGMNGDVSSLTTWDPDGAGPLPPQLVAGGLFTTAGDVLVRRIARWDGTAWLPLNTGLNGGVLCLTTWDPDGAGPLPPEVVAGGAFNAEGVPSVPLLNIARWNGTSWQMFSDGLSGAVESLASWDPDGDGPAAPRLVAGGFFLQTGLGSPLSRIAWWDGAAWQPFSASDMNGVVAALASWDPDGSGPLTPLLIAGGGFTTAGGAAALRIASWNGSAWQPLGGGFTGVSAPRVQDLLVWDPDGTGPAVAELIASGNVQSLDDPSVSFLARWNGTSWRSVGGPVSGSVSATTAWDPDGNSALPAQLVAGGQFLTADGGTVNRITRWDSSASRFFDGSSISVHSEDLFIRGQTGLTTATGAFAFSTGGIRIETGEQIVSPPTGEAWIGTAFAGFSGNSNGDYIIAGRTSANESTNDVIVLNGTTVIVREGDPVDVDGDGLFDDDCFIGHATPASSAFTSDTMFVTNDGWLYFVANIKNGAGVGYNSSGTGFANALLRVRTSAPPPPPCLGDANGDNMIDAADLSVLLANFGGPAAGPEFGDFNGDDQCDGADLSVLLAQFGNTCK